MSVSSITEWGLAGVMPLTSSVTRSAVAAAPGASVEPVAPARATQSVRTSPLSQPFSTDMQSTLLQLQSAGAGAASFAFGAVTGRVAPADSDGDSDGAAEASETDERPSQGPSSGFLDTGSAAASAPVARTDGPLGTGPGTTWTASSTYPAALQAYVQKSPTLPATVQEMA